MRYQQTIEIHERLETVLRLIRTGQYSTPGLATEVGVSIPTISRIVAALKERGHAIRAERNDGGWRYVLEDDTPATGRSRRSRTAARPGRKAGHPCD